MSELDKVMIFKTNRRTLSDGCVHCGLSRTACDGLAEMQSRRCCDDCREASHDTH